MDLVYRQQKVKIKKTKDIETSQEIEILED